MTRFVVGDDRSQSTLFPERLEDYLAEDNPVRAIDVFVDELDLGGLGFDGVEPEATGRLSHHFLGPVCTVEIELRDGNWPTKQITLHQIDPSLSHVFELFFGFDPSAVVTVPRPWASASVEA